MDPIKKIFIFKSSELTLDLKLRLKLKRIFMKSSCRIQFYIKISMMKFLEKKNSKNFDMKS